MLANWENLLEFSLWRCTYQPAPPSIPIKLSQTNILCSILQSYFVNGKITKIYLSCGAPIAYLNHLESFKYNLTEV